MSAPDQVSLPVRMRQAAAFQAEVEMQPPKPPRLRAPLVLLLLVICGLMATVLLANGGRNIYALAKALHIRIALPQDGKPDVLPASQVKPQAVNDVWRLTAPPQAVEALKPAIPPADFCRSFERQGQEEPSFSNQGAGVWECATLRQYSEADDSSSLFMQLRGSGSGFAGFRLKFNLGRAGMTDRMLDEALGLLYAGVKPLSGDDKLDAALKQKLRERQDFYFVLGYYALILRHEISDPSRLNLILINRPLPKAELVTLPDGWMSRIHRPDTKPSLKGSRLGTDLFNP